MILCARVCVCVFIKLHITAQSGPAILPGSHYFQHMCVRVYVFIAHNRAIQHRRANYCKLLAFASSNVGDQYLWAFISLHHRHPSGLVGNLHTC